MILHFCFSRGLGETALFKILFPSENHREHHKKSNDDFDECSFTWSAVSPWKTKMQYHLVHPYNKPFVWFVRNGIPIWNSVIFRIKNVLNQIQRWFGSEWGCPVGSPGRKLFFQNGKCGSSKFITSSRTASWQISIIQKTFSTRARQVFQQKIHQRGLSLYRRLYI